MNKSALAAAFFITFSAFSVQEILKPSALENAFVARVIDGDTIEIENGIVVRLLGMNTPEKAQFLYENATLLLKSLVEGRNITMEKDVVERDKYGRLLRYVSIGGVFVEGEILKRGLANTYIILPNEKHSAQLMEAEQYARENKLGLWKTDEEYAGCVSISGFNWDASGNDMENLNGEYVSFRNTCDKTINMSGWTLKDSGTKTYKFRQFYLGSGESVRLNSGCGTGTKTELFWCSKKPIWNNNGDTLYLRDAEGFLVLSESYEGRGE